MIQFLFLFVITSISNSTFASNDWVLIKTTSEGIKVEKREIEGSPVIAFRGEGVINAPLLKVASVIYDTKRAPEWIEKLEFSKVVKWLANDEWIVYAHVNTPPIIMKDRDFVSKVKLTIDTQKKIIRFTYANAIDPDAPETKYIRGELQDTTFILTAIDDDHTRVMGSVQCDPKGSVAKWIVNFFQSQWPVSTLRNLQKQVARADVKEDKKIIDLFNAAAAISPTPSPTPESSHPEIKKFL